MRTGGKRPGAGRPYGAKSGPKTVTKAVKSEINLDRCKASMIAAGIPEWIASMSPVEMMLHAASLEAAKGDWRAAAGIAKDAAPYISAKLATMEVITNDAASISPEELSDAELLQIVRQRIAIEQDKVIDVPAVTVTAESPPETL